MSKNVRKIIWRVGDETLRSLFESAGVAFPDDVPERPKLRVRTIYASIADAEQDAQGQLEKVCTRLKKFVGAFAEHALRQACRGRSGLIAICDAEQGLLERTARVLLADGKAFLRAASIEHSYRFRGRQDHDAFRVVVSAPAEGREDIDLEHLKDEIVEILRSLDGSGRLMDIDAFTYPSEPSDPSQSHDLLHVTAYAQGAATSAPEVLEGGVDYVVRRPAHEVTIDFDPKTGRLDIAGRRIGGKKVRMAIAQAVSDCMSADGPPAPIKVTELSLESLSTRRDFDVSVIEGLQAIRVASLTFEPPEEGAGSSRFDAGPGSDAWERIAAQRIPPEILAHEEVIAADLQLEFVPTEDEEPHAPIITLELPNRIEVSKLGLERSAVLDRLLPELGLLKPVQSGSDET